MKQLKPGSIRMFVAIVILAATIGCMVTGTEAGAQVLAFHPGPAWVKLAAGYPALGIALTVVLLGTTLVFGRYFCAVLCPLGVTQDIIGAVRHKAEPSRKANPRALRYGIAAVALIALIGGWAVAFRYLDPFSRFGGIVSSVLGIWGVNDQQQAISFVFGGLVPLTLLVALVFWQRRLYCTSLCPIGTVLGLFAKFSILRIGIKETCTGCGRCEKRCPTACIDSKSRVIDNERCILCLDCISSCPGKSIAYSRHKLAGQSVRSDVPDRSRRGFLIVGATIALGSIAAGRVFSTAIRGMASAAENIKGLVFPPGAMDVERFARLCTSCQLCAMNCPTKIIKPSPYGFGPVRLDYTNAECKYDCTLCNSICPSGALQKLELADKQWLKLGEAVVDLPKCQVVKDGITCDLCAKACPKGAVFMMDGPNGLKVPDVAAFHCIGCGACQAVCPMQQKAVVVGEVVDYF